MNWVFEHPQIILAIAGAIAYWLKARNQAQAGEADSDGDGEPDSRPQSGRAFREQDPTLLHDENTRRIQEEIRRKIAERQAAERGGPVVMPASREAAPLPPPLATPAPVARRREVEASPYATQELDRRAAQEREAAAVLEKQRALAEQLSALKQRRAEAAGAAQAIRETASAAFQNSTNAVGRAAEEISWAKELRSARSLRKAIVLNEVLATPVGLR
jgi:hypothetical protein